MDTADAFGVLLVILFVVFAHAFVGVLCLHFSLGVYMMGFLTDCIVGHVLTGS